MTEVLCWNCSRPAKYKRDRLCARCYQRIDAHGDVTVVKTPERSSCLYRGCDGWGRNYGWCTKHWRRIAKNNDPDPTKWSKEHPSTCTVEGCDLPYRSMGMCEKHYSRQRKREAAKARRAANRT